MPVVEVIRTYLQLLQPDELRAASVDDAALRIDTATGDVAIFRTLYREIGAAHHWHDRDAWSDETLRAHLASPDVALLVLIHYHDRVGFAELTRETDGSVQIAYFGVRAESQGRGFGKHLLTAAARAAWEMGATRVWLHTCTLDAPAAITNYRARGFQPYHTETYEALIPDAPPASA